MATDGASRASLKAQLDKAMAAVVLIQAQILKWDKAESVASPESLKPKEHQASGKAGGKASGKASGKANGKGASAMASGKGSGSAEEIVSGSAWQLKVPRKEMRAAKKAEEQASESAPFRLVPEGWSVKVV